MGELALYRKYRSGTFDEVIGQDHVVKTLTAALSSGRLRHAYLFTGPRGVGKTSVARLLARALNCTGSIKPCNECANCQTGINSSLDIVEMDAASNRSIDAIRDLRDKVNLAPGQGQYKVYIIDEVHMLTTEAHNALLKTLEEPPAHAVFILATTEAHKLPETIISRTQAFHFKPISSTDLSAHLAKIAKSEGIQITPEALEIIATAARGGFRDALTLLDQLSGSAEKISDVKVRDLLGYSSVEEVETLSRALAEHDALAALAVATRLDASGAQASVLAGQLATFWRGVMLTATEAAAAPNALSAELAKTVPVARIARIITELLEVTRSPWPQLALETTLVRLTATIPVTQPAPAAPTTSSNLPKPSSTASQPAATPAAAPAKPTASSTDASLWPKVLVIMKSQNNSLAALMQMYPVEFEGDSVTIKPRFNFHRDLFLKPANRTIIEAAIAKVYGRPFKLLAQTEETKTKRAKPSQTAELVSSALEILGGEVVE